MSDYKKGIFNAILAYVIWGLYPVYWWLLAELAPAEVLANRMFWAFFVLLIPIIVLGKSSRIKGHIEGFKKDPKKLLPPLIAAFLLSLNWIVFIYAAGSGYVLDASLGYYINPIFSVLLGVVIFRERLNGWQVAASVIATIAVLFLTIFYGVFPWIAIAMAATFGFYGMVKKKTEMDAMDSLFFEMTLALPFTGGFFVFWLADGSSAFLSGDWMAILLLVGAGLITVPPLYFFSKASQKIPLKVLGFLQYILPTLQMLVAVFIIGESLSTARLLTFITIWIACGVFSIGSLMQSKNVA